MQLSSEASQRFARISAHLHSPNLQKMEESSLLRRENCRAKGGAPGFKVAILGAAGGIGQPLAMLVKMNPLVSVLHLYDVVNSPGVAADVSHMDTGAVAEVLGIDPRDVDVPVVGGHSGVTILPLLSQVKPACTFTADEINYLTDRIQNGGTEVVEAKAGAGSATLSMAYGAAKFADACLRGLRGDAGIVECSFVASQVTELPFFASKVRLGRGGAEEVFPLGPLSEYERFGLEKAKKELVESIHKGISFIRK
ncbi:malate dehydrogenase, glyoxysomal isoform X6 [Elaeis guineensis]|uniref:malate dehydrogenase n=1 Tax=Elaeis guineensis var. tenera TaxID=51953 RepID=A0A8N4IBU8_ELAGV|nr:malate dehydrogenase, glyoxysomal isoform X5 [Elaeis guineensis]